MIGVSVLGSTGTVGCQTLEVLAMHPDRFTVCALTAHTDVEALYAQCMQWSPRCVAMADAVAAGRLRERLRSVRPSIEVLEGQDGLCTAATLPEADQVMAAIVGAAGLEPLLAAAAAGKRLLLANKEPLIMAGGIFMAAIHAGGAELLPVDSEHNALFQCGAGGTVHKVMLTASGGPFRSWTRAQLAEVTPAQALRHPNWSMGPKITVDSATLMNKGLEVIEACWLFDLSLDVVEVVVHPQSIVHALVEYADGSVLAHLGSPDMRVPIAHALAWPERVASGAPWLDLCALGRLEFEPPDLQRFPCLRMAREALQAGGAATAVLNAANEVAVAGFLAGQLGFTAIPELIDATLQGLPGRTAEGLEDVLAADRDARVYARQQLERYAA